MKLTKLIFALAAGAMLIACEKNGEGDGNGTISVIGGTEYNVEVAGKTLILDIETSAEFLNCTEDPETDWLEANYESTVKKLTITVSENKTTAARSTTVKLTALNYTPAVITINQAAADETGDPYKPTNPDEYFVFEWNDDITAENWVYDYPVGSPSYNLQLENTYKFESVNWGENGLPAPSTVMAYQHPVGQNYCTGLRLSSELLAKLGDKPLRQISLLVTENTTAVTFEIIKVKAAADEASTPSWKKGNCVEIDGEPLYTFEATVLNNGSGFAEWYNFDNYDVKNRKSPVKDKSIKLPTDEDIMIMAKVTCDGNFYLYHQPENKFAKAYINDAQAEANGMFPISGGNPGFSFVTEKNI